MNDCVNIKIAIIVPIYNDAQYIATCLDSIIRQNYTLWECLLVDDCSSDGSALIAENYCAKDSRFRLLKHSQNRGAAAARNTALRIAVGEYLFLLDSDDRFCDNNSLNLLVQQTVDSKPDWVQGSYQRSNGQITAYGDNIYCGNEISINFSKINFANAAGKLIRHNFVTDNDLFFTEGIIYEDLDWNVRAYRVAQTVTTTNTPTYYHNLSENSVMRSVFSQKKVESLQSIITTILSTTPDNNLRGVVIFNALFLLKNLLMGQFSTAYKKEQYHKLSPALAITPNYKTLPPFTRLLAHVRRNYHLSQILCSIYRWKQK